MMRPMKNLPSLSLFCLLQVVLLFGGSGVQNTVEAGVCSGKQIKACCAHCSSLCRPLENRPTLEHRGQLVVSYPSCLKRCNTLCRSSKATFEKKLYVSEHPLSVCVQKWFEQEGCQPFSLGLFFFRKLGGPEGVDGKSVDKVQKFPVLGPPAHASRSLDA